jgi:TPR repeat protein
MKRLLTILTILFCLTSNVVWSADFQKGVAAAQSGDFATALREWKPLAEQGDAVAQKNLGHMYNKGKGVLQGYVRAHMWYNIASISGKSKNASKNRDSIAKEMTPSQIETAQKLARECVRKKYKGC